MRIVKSISEIEENFSLTIGNFDGVHLGHQSVLTSILNKSKKDKIKLCVMTFVPHPIQILSPRENFLINTYNERRELLKEIGVDYLVEIDFNRDLSTLTPSEFMDKFILNTNKLKIFYVGHDFAFGANKMGDHHFIINYSKKSGIKVEILEKFCQNNQEHTISSTSIRSLLQSGVVDTAAKLLGRNFFISGLVIKGAGRGKQIGIPTANLEINPLIVTPSVGVYATYVSVDGNRWEAVTNVGHNPTFNDVKKLNIESHILDFDADIYGKEIKLEFVKKIREEKKFTSVNELVVQIRSDIQSARGLF